MSPITGHPATIHLAGANFLSNSFHSTDRNGMMLLYRMLNVPALMDKLKKAAIQAVRGDI